MARKVKKKPEQYSELPCQECRAQCCRYIAVEIDTPRTKKAYDDIRWYLLHENVHVFLDHDDAWHIEFRSKCRALGKDQRCHEYETRPQVCRDHGWPIGSCEFFDSPHKVCFTCLEEYERYLDREKIDWRYRRRPRTRQQPDTHE